MRTRFELVVRLPVRQFSKLVVSATHPPHQSSVLFPIASAKVVYFSLTANFHIAFFTNLSKVTINQHKGWMVDDGRSEPQPLIHNQICMAPHFWILLHKIHQDKIQK